MIRFVVVLLLSALPFSAQAEGSQVIAPPTTRSSGCDLSVTGIDHAAFTKFFSELQDAVRKSDNARVAALVSYPVKVKVGKKKVSLKNAADFQKHVADALNPRVKEAITGAKLETLFCNYQGVMVGDSGQVWISSVQKKGQPEHLAIIAINN